MRRLRLFHANGQTTNSVDETNLFCRMAKELREGGQRGTGRRDPENYKRTIDDNGVSGRDRDWEQGFVVGELQAAKSDGANAQLYATGPRTDTEHSQYSNGASTAHGTQDTFRTETQQNVERRPTD